MVMLRTENVGGGGHWILDFGAISAKIFFATFSPIANGILPVIFATKYFASLSPK
jgi:hypothetical protein